MFVDACAIIALLSDEPEAQRVSDALAGAKKPITSPVAVLEAALGLARADKFGMSVEAVEPIILEFLDARGIEIRDLPPAKRELAAATAWISVQRSPASSSAACTATRQRSPTDLSLNFPQGCIPSPSAATSLTIHSSSSYRAT